MSEVEPLSDVPSYLDTYFRVNQPPLTYQSRIPLAQLVLPINPIPSTLTTSRNKNLSLYLALAP